MSYTINGYEILEAEYAVEDNTAVFLTTANVGIAVKDSSWGPSNDGTHWATLLSLHPSTIFIKPYKEFSYLVWDYTNNVWVIDQDLFTAELKNALKNRRDEQLSTEVVFNGVTAVNTPEERNLIIGIIVLLQAYGSEFVIKWKQPNGDFADATLADFQGLMRDGGLATQKAFSTEAHILEQHAATPFTSIQDAIDAFDAYLASL